MSARAEIAERVTDAKCRLLDRYAWACKLELTTRTFGHSSSLYKGRAEAYEHDYQLLCDLLPEQFLGDDEPNE